MMTTSSKVAIKTSERRKFSALLKSCIRQQLTGQLSLRTLQGAQWTLTFFMGRLIRADGGEHPLRRWRRHLSLHCPQFQLDPEKALPSGNLLAFETWDYDALINLVEQRQVSREQAMKAIDGSIIEVLFDILQSEELSQFEHSEALQYSVHPSPHSVLQNPPLIPTGIKYLWQQAQKSWLAWKSAGFMTRSPNLAPVLNSPERIQTLLQSNKSKSVRTFLRLVNGQRTLRDLGVKVGHNPLPLLKFLMPYIGRELVEVVSLPDLDFDLEEELDLVTVAATTPLSFIPTASASQPAVASQPATSQPADAQPSATSSDSSGPLIAYVDDSPLYHEVMGEILLGEEGWQFLGIQDAFRALPLLLEKKPDLIFLDLVMPIVSGYEICAQIRRTDEFKNTPIVIVTSSNTLVDRVRAKFAGASDFIAKPLKADQLLTLVKKSLNAKV